MTSGRTHTKDAEHCKNSERSILTDGGEDRATCGDCGATFAEERRRILVRPDSAGGDHVDLCPECQTKYPNSRQYKPATDGGVALDGPRFHVVCHDCTFESVKESEVVAARNEGYHLGSTGHNVEYAEVISGD